MPRLTREPSPLAAAAVKPRSPSTSGERQPSLKGMHVADAVEALIRELLRQNRNVKGAAVSLLANEDTIVITLGKPPLRDDARTHIGTYTGVSSSQVADDFEHHLATGGLA